MGKHYIEQESNENIRFQGRIIHDRDMAVMGYTNTSFTIHISASRVCAFFRTGANDPINAPGLRVYVDGKAVKETVLSEPETEVELARFATNEEHIIRVVKITEAGMSFAGVVWIDVDGELMTVPEDTRTKALFIGDSITCGYGVLGAPEAEYTIRDEDGELSYAAVLAKNMDWNAEWVSVSGHGMFVEYTGDPENILPREFPYTNWFYNKEIREDYSRFQPDWIIMNLGTNDQGSLGNPWILGGFKSRYESFLYTLRIAYPNAKIVCVLGTLAPGIFAYVREVIDKVKAAGMKDLYGLELPFHDVEHDGIASGHPTAVTHEKDAKRIEEFIRAIR
ncbi:MAG: hypothetical protein K6F93_02795 [Lachnospiraceae bacterium]|nr:hypothetical protein [Lachnospiraceae bacterium]